MTHTPQNVNEPQAIFCARYDLHSLARRAGFESTVVSVDTTTTVYSHRHPLLTELLVSHRFEQISGAYELLRSEWPLAHACCVIPTLAAFISHAIYEVVLLPGILSC